MALWAGIGAQCQVLWGCRCGFPPSRPARSLVGGRQRSGWSPPPCSSSPSVAPMHLSSPALHQETGDLLMKYCHYLIDHESKQKPSFYYMFSVWSLSSKYSSWLLFRFLFFRTKGLSQDTYLTQRMKRHLPKNILQTDFCWSPKENFELLWHNNIGLYTRRFLKHTR